MLRVARRRQRRRNTGWVIVAVVAVVAAIGVPQVLTRGQEHPANPSPAALETPLAEYPRGVITESDPIRGRRAFSLRPRNVQGAPEKDPRYVWPEDEYLCWEYADGALAILMPASSGLSRDDMRRVAEGLTVSPERPVTVPFAVGHLPAGYRLTAAGRSMLRFDLAKNAAASLARPERGYADVDAWGQGIEIVFGETRTGALRTGCDGSGCRRLEGGGRYQIRVDAKLPRAEVRKILESITVADYDHRDTWIPVDDAVPASTRLRVR